MTYYICHSGIKGMRWGVRRFQNADGTLTELGKKRYGKYQSAEVSRENEKYAKISQKNSVKSNIERLKYENALHNYRLDRIKNMTADEYMAERKMRNKTSTEIATLTALFGPANLVLNIGLADKRVDRYREIGFNYLTQGG